MSPRYRGLKIAISIGGATNGLWSASSSEHRYPQAVALALADAGYTVDCFGGGHGAYDHPSWGDMPPVPGVNLLHITEVLGKNYDICLNIPFEHTPWAGQHFGPYERCNSYQVRARLYVHFTFGWHSSMVANYNCYSLNHIFVYPRAHLASLPYGQENPFKYLFLPIPIGKEYIPVGRERKNIVWPSKDVFHPDWYPDRMTVPRIGLATLWALGRLASKYPELHVDFLGTRYFDEDVSRVARILRVQEALGRIPNKSLHGFVPHNVLCDVFKQSRVTTPISGMWSSFGESICSGSVSLAYGDMGRTPPTSEFCYFPTAVAQGLGLDVHHATEDQIFLAMDRIYSDDDLYLSLIHEYRESAKDHLYSSVVDHFESIIDEVL